MNGPQKKPDPSVPKQKPSQKRMKELVDAAKPVKANKIGAPSRIRKKL